MKIIKLSSYKKTIFTKLLIDLILLFFMFPISTTYFGTLIISAGFLMTNLLVIKTLFLPKIWIFSLRILAVICFLFNSIYFANNIIIREIITLLTYLSYSGFIFLAIIAIGSKIFTQTRVDADVINGGISIFLLLGFLWFSLYNIIFAIDPGAFQSSSLILETESNYQLFYYSFTTLTTLGYGDIVPVNKFAMTLATSEAIVGLMYPAIFISRLVGLYTTEPKSNCSESESEE